jgi:hypothetical protein
MAAVTVDVTERRAVLVLASCIAALLIAGAASSTIAIGLRRDYAMGLVPLFDLNGEHNVPAWFSSMQLLATALLLAWAASGAPAEYRRHWGLLSGVFLLLSLDEAASLHEMANGPLRRVIHAGPMLYFPWIAIGVAFAGAVALSQVKLLRMLPRRTSVLFVAAGAWYLAGAVGMEAIAAPVYAASGKATALHALLVWIEEGLEMTGIAVFFVVVLRYVREHHEPVRVAFGGDQRGARGVCHLSPQRVASTLMLVIGALVVLNLAVQCIHFLTAAHWPNLLRFVNLSREGNLPTWYQSATLFLAGGVAGLVAVAARQQSDPFRYHWTAVALVFIYLSMDEGAAIHELTVRPLRAALGATGILYYSWIILGALAVVASGVLFRRFIAGLPVPTRRRLIVAAIVFLSGALGVEALGGMFAEINGRNNLAYGLITTVEETCEMAGVALFIVALLEHLRDHAGVISIGPGSTPSARRV